MIPGIDILSLALGVIGSQEVVYYKYLDKTTSATLRDVPVYADGVVISTGSLQPVPRSKYEFMGLDFNRSYVNWFVPVEVLGLVIQDIGRDVSPDQLEWNGSKYQVISLTPWDGQDGWVEALCQKL